MPRCFLYLAPVRVLALLIALASEVAVCADSPAVDFVDDVAPILEQHCLQCHKTSDPNGELDLSIAANVIKREPAIVVPGNPDESLLFAMISGDAPEMPQDAPPLSAQQVETIRRWIAAGASWPTDQKLIDKTLADADWWSLKPLQLPDLPLPRDADSAWVRTPVDNFVIAKLSEQGLSPSSEASRRVLIRRLYFDLIGLPPEPQAIEDFIADPDPRAYEKLVDQLLASPRYGERWARHWLDVVHYGDTHGFDKDKVREHAWPYRDYVIRAFNNDVPYDRFVGEQLAGDVLYPGEDDGIVALGFIAAGPFDWVGQIEVAEGSMEKQRVRNLDRDDMVRNVIETFCSATIGCARCHDHKFDPFTSEDYYSLQAVFASVDRADRLYDVDPAVEAKRTELQARLQQLKTQVDQLEGKPDQQLATALEEAREQLAVLPKQKYVFAAATSFAAQGQFRPTLGQPRPVYLLQRGNESTPIRQVSPGAMSCLSYLESRFSTSNDGESRAALARWILHEQNPLTWRSIVNRIWHYHFGRGIVDTPNDLGRMGSLPSHPELLDWLAATFRDGDRSIKSLHRMIVNSATYRQASAHNEQHARLDGANRYLWRMNRRRLEAEAVRDTVLAVSGKLDHTMYGPGFRPFGFEDDHSPRYKYEEYDPDQASSHRRAIYRFIVRSAPDPFLETLDCADPSTIVPKRNETLTALQSLALLNNRFMIRMAELFAERVQGTAETVSDQLAQAIRLSLGREPTASELELLAGIANQHGLPNACRLIFNTNEFVFVD
ncbi:MAG: PSD1 domain-containing protein [Planctomycetales bacterium]|nr:PSD1 domain-containing protein [Planctomycetales bacterium]